MAELKGAALREKEGQFQAISKTVQDLYRSLIELQNSGAVSGNSLVSKHVDLLGNFVSSTFTVHIGEPTRILGDFEGSGNDFNRLLSFLREREGEVGLLKTRLIDVEKKLTGSGAGSSSSWSAYTFQTNRYWGQNMIYAMFIYK